MLVQALDIHFWNVKYLSKIVSDNQGFCKILRRGHKTELKIKIYVI